MENLNLVVAKNLIALRKSQNLTQIELAEKLNYSDKSISKWEKGEAVPSLEVLTQFCNLFAVPLDYFIKENEVISAPSTTKPRKNKLVVTLLSMSVAWLTALVLYSVLLIFTDIDMWTIFLWVVPVCFLLATIFSCLWSLKRRFVYISISLLIWTALSALYFQLLEYNIWILFLIGIPLQTAVILWVFLRK